MSTRVDTDDKRALVVERVSIAFDGKRVLRDVDLTFPAGTVSGLIGHNGSGKSTLVRILAGYHRPEAGTCWVARQPLSFGSPMTADRLGLRFVHQDLGLVREFTPLENFGIGGEFSRTRWRTIDWAAQARRLRAAFDVLGSPVPPDVPVAELSAVERSLTAIARAIDDRGGASETRFIVLDEPTSTLEAPEKEQLFGVVRRMADAGIGVVLISHQLEEVLDLCSAVSVLRDGQVVGTFPTAGLSGASLVQAMLGPEAEAVGSMMEEHRGVGAPRSREDQKPAPALAVRGLRSSALRDVTLTLRRGECTCVVGVAGSGREQLVYAVTGAVPAQVERVEIDGERIPKMSLPLARQRGIALIPGNRLPGSLVNEFATRENLSLASLSAVSGRLGYIDRRRERAAAEAWVERFDIRPRDLEQKSRYLSGGNKQKVIMAKWLSIAPMAMLIDEPTAGVDVGVVSTLFETLREFVEQGGALLVSTSEIKDALALADRVVVLSEGSVSRVLRRGEDEFSEQGLLLAMLQGGRSQAENRRAREGNAARP